MSFGNVRNIQNYAMASASTMRALADAQAKLQVLSDQKVTLVNAVTTAKANVQNNRQLYIDGQAGWNGCKNSDCNWNHSSGRCNRCRDPFNEMMLSSERRKPALATKLSSAQGLVTTKQAEIVEHQTTIASILNSIKAENKAEQTLASQGTSSAQLVIDAEAEAERMVIEAQQKAENDERKSKSKKLIIVTIILAGVSLAVIFAIYKIKKLRSKKKRKTK